jgi:hypothetical protein
MTELEKIKLSKDEFIYWTKWINMRWPNVKTSAAEIKSLYNDFSIYNDDILGQAAVEQLDEGSEFFSWPKLKRRCKEIYNELLIDQVNAAKSKQEKKELLKDRPGTLGAYLASQGWKSFEEAIFYTRVRLYRTNKLYSWDMPSMEKYKDMEYKEAVENGWKMGLMFDGQSKI